MIEDIYSHFEKEYPKEGCGIIGITKGKKEWFPCKNIAENNSDFVMCSEDYFKVLQKTNIYAIVHNHINTSNEPSIQDIENCNALGIPYYIFSYPDMKLNILEPKNKLNKLIGREYKFGVADCFEAVRDWLSTEEIHVPPRHIFKESWWQKGEDYFTEDMAKYWNHVKVDSPIKNDVIVFSVSSTVPNHCGVYLGNDIFFHHARHRLSCRENLYPFWAKYVTGFYRYDA